MFVCIRRESGKEETWQEGVPFKRYGYPFPCRRLSCNISGLTFRLYSRYCQRRTYAACFISAFPSMPFDYMFRIAVQIFAVSSFWGVYIYPVVATPHHLRTDTARALTLNLDHAFRIFESDQLGAAVRAVLRMIPYPCIHPLNPLSDIRYLPQDGLSLLSRGSAFSE